MALLQLHLTIACILTGLPLVTSFSHLCSSFDYSFVIVSAGLHCVFSHYLYSLFLLFHKHYVKASLSCLSQPSKDLQTC